MSVALVNKELLRRQVGKFLLKCFNSQLDHAGGGDHGRVALRFSPTATGPYFWVLGPRSTRNVEWGKTAIDNAHYHHLKRTGVVVVRE